MDRQPEGRRRDPGGHPRRAQQHAARRQHAPGTAARDRQSRHAASPSPAAPPPDAMKQSDQYQRAYDLGREVSVTRATPGSVKRLSVAVLLRDPDKTRRTAMEINQITDLVKSAVGFDQTRNDNVTVISRKFAGADAAADTGPAWYDNAWLPVLARNGTAIVIALLVLLLGVRPIAKALMKKREDATPRPAFGQTIEGAESEDAEALTGPVVIPPGQPRPARKLTRL
ncbi:flagellar M-ring protein FliF C-terminal domain-containing protein [Sphingomonas sp. Ant20]|uniref:flagellar M-ring protein FliF C-terminal domain-containing protein n=1 Tax=Sphingomonas sp. Ant20 TaxID=104605 RepID=UPI002741BBC3|nr:flagellar M-ring protein FliF C-terminal domain-containing protein [Sphingomonas sp. Ant20]